MQSENKKLPEHEAKRLHRWIIFFFLTGIIGSILHVLPRADSLRANSPVQKTHVHIGGRDFAVPNEYFRGPIPREKESKQLYIWAMLPDYEPYRDEFNRAHNQDDINAIWNKHILVLIDDTAYTTDLKFRYNARRNGPDSIYKPKDVPDVFGLHHTLVYYSNPRVPEPYVENDLYYKKIGGQIEEFAACDRDDPTARLHPGCKHVFQDGRMLYALTYRKTHLPEFSEIQNRIHTLVESFSCAPNSSDKKAPPEKTEEGMQICPP